MRKLHFYRILQWLISGGCQGYVLVATTVLLLFVGVSHWISPFYYYYYYYHRHHHPCYHLYAGIYDYYYYYYYYYYYISFGQ